MKTSVGVDGRRALGALYRLGTLTAPQLAVLEGMPRSTAQEVLQALRKNKLVDQRDQKPSWENRRRGRAPAHFYLHKRSGGQAILHGAEAAGVRLKGRKDEKEALERYARCGMPYQIPHRYLGNSACVALINDAKGTESVDISSLDMHAECYEDFPLTSEGDRKIYPDGIFTVSWGNLAQRFHLETETNERRADLLAKIDAYSARWLSLRTAVVAEHERELRARFRVTDDARAQKFAETWIPVGFSGLAPVVFVYPTAETAARMRLYTFNAVRESRASLTRYLRLSKKWEGHGIYPGWFFLFAGLNELQAGALDSYCMPVSAFDDEWGRFEVPLRACASVVEQCYRLDDDLRISWEEKIAAGHDS